MRIHLVHMKYKHIKWISAAYNKWWTSSKHYTGLLLIFSNCKHSFKSDCLKGYIQCADVVSDFGWKTSFILFSYVWMEKYIREEIYQWKLRYNKDKCTKLGKRRMMQLKVIYFVTS